MNGRLGDLESDVRYTYQLPYMESQVSRFTYWPTIMECKESSLESAVRFTYWAQCIECQV